MHEAVSTPIKQTPITILGAGSWGTALAIVLAQNGQPTRLWGHDPDHIAKIKISGINDPYLPGIKLPENLVLYDRLDQALEGVKDILIAVPSHAFAETLIAVKSLAAPDLRIAWGTKGCDPHSLKLLDATVADIFHPCQPMAVLAGPSFAKEVADGLPTAVTAASNSRPFAHDLVTRFHNHYFRVYTSDDIIGAEVGGLVKNTLAIAAGIVDGLHLGGNALSAMITRGLTEMTRLAVALGGKPKTIIGLAGLGDLILTCTGNQSRNRRFGVAIAQGKTLEQAKQEIGKVIEGLANLKSAHRLREILKISMPITEQVYKIVYENTPPISAVNALFARNPRKEIDC